MTGLLRATAIGLTSALLLSGCQSAGAPAVAVAPVRPGPQLPVEIRVRVAGRVVSVAFEDYVAGTALSEVTPIGESADVIERVYDVQTVVARTYALAHLGRHRAEGFDVCDTTHCQLYEPARLGTSRLANDARRAATRTAHTVLVFSGRPIDALFHADCGGHTASPEQVWGTAPLPYLRSEPDIVSAPTHRAWSLQLSREQIRQALNTDARTKVGKTLHAVSPGDADSSGRLTSVAFKGDRTVTMRADDFRAAMNRSLGPKAIQSTRFSIRKQGNGYQLDGTGFGHGVGLCQLGALARARKGASATEVLATYFPGARLSSLSVRIP